MMKKNLLKKASMLVLAGAVMLGSALTAHAAAGQWKQDSTGRWWIREEILRSLFFFCVQKYLSAEVQNKERKSPRILRT